VLTKERAALARRAPFSGRSDEELAARAAELGDGEDFGELQRARERWEAAREKFGEKHSATFDAQQEFERLFMEQRETTAESQNRAAEQLLSDLYEERAREIVKRSFDVLDAQLEVALVNSGDQASLLDLRRDQTRPLEERRGYLKRYAAALERAKAEAHAPIGAGGPFATPRSAGPWADSRRSPTDRPRGVTPVPKKPPLLDD
jgi:hypothetical protein